MTIANPPYFQGAYKLPVYGGVRYWFVCIFPFRYAYSCKSGHFR